MRKGVTPVVATVLLMFITIAGAGTVYTVVQANTEGAQSNLDESNLNLDTDTLRVETCYNRYDRTHIVMRNNDAENAVNTSEITPLLNGTVQEDYRIDKEIADPQRSFTINLSEKFGQETQVILTDGSNEITYRCS